MTRPGNRAARAIADGEQESRTTNGWNEPEPLRRLIERILDILRQPERHAHADLAELEACCSPNGRSLRFLRAVHDCYAPCGEFDARYADGHAPDAPPVPTTRDDSAVVTWIRLTVRRLMEIESEPARHDHFGMDELNACCSIDGRFDWCLLVAHWMYATLGHNPMEACDALEGPCACGAWHKWGEPR